MVFPKEYYDPPGLYSWNILPSLLMGQVIYKLGDPVELRSGELIRLYWKQMA